MYLDLKTDDRELVMRLLAGHEERAEPTHITLSKLGDLYRLTLVQKSEPPVT